MMGEHYHRAQILLEPEQHRRLRRIAEREGRSISDVAREVVATGLEALARDEGARDHRRAQALKHLSQIRGVALARHGLYEGDLVGGIRSKREQDLEQVRRSRQ
jgi:hypothetical protein